MSKLKYIITIAFVAMAAVILTIQYGKSDRHATGDKFRAYKMTKRSGDTSKKPTEWFTISRAYPYRDIPFATYKAALDRAEAVYRASASLETFTCTPVGPYNVGGRVTALAAHPNYPGLIYAGAALGGVFKTTDGGNSWAAISDSVPSLSVGDIAIDPGNPQILYFGTGEANSSGDSYAGTGLYRTTDGGESWELLGLEESRHIGRIAIDPSNSQKIFAACMGSLFSTSQTRGLYRSDDSGDAWQQVLYTNDSTGCIDVAINPNNTNIVFAALWQRIRGPEDRQVGGVHSGIYRSTDGGDTWQRLTAGLPPSAANIGRIGLAIAPTNPDIIYASYVDHPGNLIGFWRSADGGDTWQARLISPGIGSFSGFGWYFGRIWVHPANENIVYFGDVDFWRSTDGGQRWSALTGEMHVDQHALYQNPDNPNYMVCGNDGGVFISQNAGTSWTKIYDLPITQFYAITIDKRSPQRLYGGTQDNSTPRTVSGQPDDWDVIFFGDGFYANVDYTNSNVIYAEAQYGYLGKSTNLGNNWDIIFSSYDHDERSNWCTPVVMSPQNNRVLFYGAQRVYKTSDGGGSWAAISPDLTGGPGGGNLLFGTITTIDQSPVNADIIWAGTDDSRVWVTQDGGTSWDEVSDDLPDRWCTRVTADIRHEAAGYVAFSGYRVDDLMPHIFRTDDYGLIWQDISGNLQGVPVNDILQDPTREGWLYIGTDFGMFYSDDSGQTWQGMSPLHPICPVFDIDISPDPPKLVSGTHGRSMYEFDLGFVGVPESEARPLAFKLNQNYPNPFNATTAISFEARQAGNISLNIYDVTGRLVKTLLDGPVTGGEHKLSFDGSGLASGVYFLSLKADNCRASKKMTLIK